MPDCGKQRSLFHSPWKTLPRFPHFSPRDCGYAPLEKGILIVRNAKKYLTAINGLAPGDKVIVTDMSKWADVPRVQLK